MTRTTPSFQVSGLDVNLVLTWLRFAFFAKLASVSIQEKVARWIVLNLFFSILARILSWLGENFGGWPVLKCAFFWLV